MQNAGNYKKFDPFPPGMDFQAPRSRKLQPVSAAHRRLIYFSFTLPQRIQALLRMELLLQPFFCSLWSATAKLKFVLSKRHKWPKLHLHKPFHVAYEGLGILNWWYRHKSLRPLDWHRLCLWLHFFPQEWDEKCACHFSTSWFSWLWLFYGLRPQSTFLRSWLPQRQDC